jgi:CheY-like chemotaxis protein
MSLSERQVYRALRKAEQDLAALLQTEMPGENLIPAEPEALLSRRELVLQEARRAEGAPTLIPLGQLLRRVVQAVAPLADRLGVAVKYTIGDPEPTVRLDEQMFRQGLVSILCHAIQDSVPGTAIRIAVLSTAHDVRLCLNWPPRDRDAQGADRPTVGLDLVQGAGGRYWLSVEQGHVRLEISLLAQSRLSLLVVDDNEGLIDLFRRYLGDQDIEIIPAADGQEGLRLARSLVPDLIVLDVMMPRQDGWDVLMQLQASSETRHIPVIVCSVLDNPALASSLGATAFLPKPVSRPQLLGVLSRVHPELRGLESAAQPGASRSSPSW